MRPYVPEWIEKALRDIRSGMHLRWNPTAVVKKAGSYDAVGKLREPEYEARWEVWDVDPEGAEYMVMRLQDMDGGFRQPGEWMVERLKFMNPARYGGDLMKLYEEMVENPELLREVGTQKDSDDLIDAITRAAEWGEKPKSAAGISYRGKRLLSA